MIRDRVALLVAFTAVACGPKQAREKAPEAVATPSLVREIGTEPSVADGGEAKRPTREEKHIAKTLENVSLARQLKATHAVPGVTLDRTAMLARVRAKFEKEIPRVSIERDGHVLELVGVAPIGFDYLGETMRLLDAQLGGFYDPDTGEMVLAADLSGPAAGSALSHELVHALQDQHWNLKSRMHYRPGESDTSLATSALAEGDATSAMMDIMIRSLSTDRSALDIDDEILAAQLEAGMDLGVGANVPHAVKAGMIAPYSDGMRFVHALRRSGGWEEVNRAWERAPTTTEQILHPEKWKKGEGALSVSAPESTPLGEGWVRAFDDTSGELGLALTFAEWFGPKQGRAAAKDWGGDRMSLFESGAKLALALHLRYDDEGGAARAFRILSAPAKEKRGETEKASGGTSAAVCYERKRLGPFAIVLKKRELAMVFGPVDTSPPGWKSSGTCAQAKTWAAAIADQP